MKISKDYILGRIKPLSNERTNGVRYVNVIELHDNTRIVGYDLSMTLTPGLCYHEDFFQFVKVVLPVATYHVKVTGGKLKCSFLIPYVDVVL